MLGVYKRVRFSLWTLQSITWVLVVANESTTNDSTTIRFVIAIIFTRKSIIIYKNNNSIIDTSLKNSNLKQTKILFKTNMVLKNDVSLKNNDVIAPDNLSMSVYKKNMHIEICSRRTCTPANTYWNPRANDSNKSDLKTNVSFPCDQIQYNLNSSLIKNHTINLFHFNKETMLFHTTAGVFINAWGCCRQSDEKQNEASDTIKIFTDTLKNGV